MARYIDGFTFRIETAAENPYLAESNGYINHDTNVIHLNIEAGRALGNIGDVALEAAWTHEVGHGIKKNAPLLFEELKSFIKDNFYQGNSWDNAVERRRQQYQEQMNKAAEAKGKGEDTFTWEKAEEEVVCNSLGQLLGKSSVMRKLAGEHRSLFGRIWRAVQDFFGRIADRIRQIGINSNKSVEQKMVEQGISEKQTALEELFVTALRAASTAARASADARLAESAAKATDGSNAAKNASNSTVTTTDDSNGAVSPEKSGVTSTKSENMHVSGEELSFSSADDNYIGIISGMSEEERQRGIEVADFIETVTQMLDASKKTKESSRSVFYQNNMLK